MIRVYDDAGNLIETHEHKGDFKEWRAQRHETKSRHAVHDGSLFRLFDRFSDYSRPFAAQLYSVQSVRSPLDLRGLLFHSRSEICTFVLQFRNRRSLLLHCAPFFDERRCR